MELKFKMLLYYILLINLFNIVTGEWNSNDYMKREHSLVRPYQGKNLFYSLF